MVDSSELGSRSERRAQVSGRFRTIRALQTDTRREQHFRWAAKYSVDANEIATLKDGVESVVNADSCELELRRWAAKYAALRETQATAVAAVAPAELPEAQRWATLLPTDVEVGKPPLKGKAALAAALARTRRLVFAHGKAAPPDPSLVLGAAPWDKAIAERLLAHPLFAPLATPAL